MKKILTSFLISCACTTVYGAAAATGIEVPTSEAEQIKEFTEKSPDFIDWAMQYYNDKLAGNDHKTGAMLAGKATELTNNGIIISAQNLQIILDKPDVENLIKNENRSKYSNQEKAAVASANESIAAATSSNENINSLTEASWKNVFPGLTAAATPGADYDVKNVVQGITSNSWDGTIQSAWRWWGSTYNTATRTYVQDVNPTINKYTIYNLDGNQLQQVLDEIAKATGINSARFGFSQPTWNNVNPKENAQECITLNRFVSAIELPFDHTELLTAMVNNFDEIKTAITNGAKRKSPISFGKNLGQTWQMVNDFIGQFATGVSELQLLFNNKFTTDLKTQIGNLPNFAITIDEDTITKFKEKHDELANLPDDKVKTAIKADYAQLVREAAVLAADAIAAYQKVNTEFEKPASERNHDEINKACDELKNTLDKILDFIGAKAGSGFNVKIRKLIEFSYTVPAIYRWHAAIAAKNTPLDLSEVAPAAREKTTAEILDNKFLNKPQNDLADKVKNSEMGDLVTTLRIGDKKWNVYKINAPEADDNLLSAAAAEIKAKGMRVQGTHPMLVRIRNDINAYWIVDFDVNANGDVHFSAGNINRPWSPNRNYNQFANRFGHWGSWNPVIIGAVEIRPVADSDRTMRNYDPMRVHGAASVRGTLMEQRIHSVMAQHKVHHFNKLPETEQIKLKGEIDNYNTERYRNTLENQGLGKYTLKSDEISNKHQEGSAERIHATQNRMEKISGEFKDRQTLARYNRFRTHGGDLTENPEELARMRVHEITGNLRTHEMRKLQNMSPREREFFGENHEGGYLDTVERAIADNNRRVDAEHMRTHGYPLSQETRVHDNNRTHLESASYEVGIGAPVSAQSATNSSYDSLTSALRDYDQYDKIPTKEGIRTARPGSDVISFGTDNIGKPKTYKKVAEQKSQSLTDAELEEKKLAEKK